MRKHLVHRYSVYKIIYKCKDACLIICTKSSKYNWHNKPLTLALALKGHTDMDCPRTEPTQAMVTYPNTHKSNFTWNMCNPLTCVGSSCIERHWNWTVILSARNYCLFGLNITEMNICAMDGILCSGISSK